jgi:hypothetical protein
MEATGVAGKRSTAYLSSGALNSRYNKDAEIGSMLKRGNYLVRDALPNHSGFGLFRLPFVEPVGRVGFPYWPISFSEILLSPQFINDPSQVLRCPGKIDIESHRECDCSTIGRRVTNLPDCRMGRENFFGSFVLLTCNPPFEALYYPTSGLHTKPLHL